MELSTIRAFNAVAEHKNISRAAEALYISQPALSKKISDLEKELEVALLLRNNRSVTLTPAGKYFYENSKQILAQVDKLTAGVKLLASEAAGRIIIGASGVERFFLPKIITEFRIAHPEIDCDVRYFTYAGQVKEHLKDGTLDIGFLLDFDVEAMAGFFKKEVRKDRLCAILPKGHPLGNRDSVTMEELQGETLVTFSSPSSLSHSMKVFEENSFKPHKFLLKETLDDIFLNIESSMGIGFVLENIKHVYRDQNVDFVRLEGKNTAHWVCAVWRQQTGNKAVKHFVDMLIDICARSEQE